MSTAQCLEPSLKPSVPRSVARVVILAIGAEGPMAKVVILAIGAEGPMARAAILTTKVTTSIIGAKFRW